MTSFYWITRLDALQGFAICCVIASVVIAIVLIIFGICFIADAYGEDDKDLLKGKKLLRSGIWSAAVAFLFSLVLVFVPTTKEMCAIYMIDYLKDNEKVQKMPEQIIDAASAFLEEQANKGKEKEQ